MKITFIGTGAGVYSPFTDGYRTYTSVLIDGLAIDAGITFLPALKAAGASPAQIMNIAYTHAHSDHWHPEVLRQLVLADGPARVAAPPKLARKIERFLLDEALPKAPEVVPLEPAGDAAFDGVRLTALEANHARIANEPSLNYLVESDGKRALYMVDSSVPVAATVKFLREQPEPADILIMDATTVMDDGHKYMFAHGSLPSVARVAECFRRTQVLKPDAPVYGIHFSAALLAERAPTERELAELGVLMPADGMRVEV